MSERLTDEQLNLIIAACDDVGWAKSVSVELRALRAAWKIAEPHLLYPIRRRCLAVLSDDPQ